MKKAKSHFKNMQAFLWVLIAFFALSPCGVKEALFSMVKTEYSQPLNKYKTTAPTNSCQFSNSDNPSVSFVKQSKTNKGTAPAPIQNKLSYVADTVQITAVYSKINLGNSPPKYILYKRLKLDVA